MAGKRGQYAPKRAKTPHPDPTLDAIQNHDVAFVPDLKLRPGKGAKDLPLVSVDTMIGDANTEIYIQSYYAAANESRRIKFVFFDNLGKSRQNSMMSIDFADNLVSFKETFSTSSAISRWPTKVKRQAAYKEWLLFVWETRTGQTAPAEKSTTATKRKRETKTAQDESDLPKSKMPRMPLDDERLRALGRVSEKPSEDGRSEPVSKDSDAEKATAGSDGKASMSVEKAYEIIGAWMEDGMGKKDEVIWQASRVIEIDRARQYDELMSGT